MWDALVGEGQGGETCPFSRAPCVSMLNREDKVMRSSMSSANVSSGRERDANAVRVRHANGGGVGGGGGGGGGGGFAGRAPRPSLADLLLMGDNADDALNKPKTERLKARRRRLVALGILATVRGFDKLGTSLPTHFMRCANARCVVCIAPCGRPGIQCYTSLLRLSSLRERSSIPAPLPPPPARSSTIPTILLAMRCPQGVLLLLVGRVVGHVNAVTLLAGMGGVVYAAWNEFYRMKEVNRNMTALNLKCKRLMEARRAAGLLRLVGTDG